MELLLAVVMIGAVVYLVMRSRATRVVTAEDADKRLTEYQQLRASLDDRDRDIVAKRLCAQDRAGRRTLKLMARNGWSIDTCVASGFWRTQIYTFSRPKVSRQERKILGWSK